MDILAPFRISTDPTDNHVGIYYDMTECVINSLRNLILYLNGNKLKFTFTFLSGT